MASHKKAYAAAMLYACIIGFAFMFVKITLTVASPIDSLAHRFTIAFFAATLILVFNKISIKIKMKDVLPILCLALLYPTLFFTFQVFGLVYTSSSEAGIIQATIPIFTLILAAFVLKEYASPVQAVCTFLSVAGVIFIFIMNNVSEASYSVKGTVLILLSSLASALYNVLARKLTRQYSLFTLTYLMTFFAFIVFNSIAITDHIIEKSVPSFFTPFLSIPFVVSIIYLGVLSSLCTAFLSNYTLSKIEASKMSVFSNFATLITVIAGVMFLHETIRYYHIIGTIAILAGVIGTNYFGKNRRVTKEMHEVKEMNT
ncbi:DMT family transporter [Ectobacillus polymachus]|uniref:DMT family transporter n=1 Tax=Ectobacillus polymachus TaxID=1508806 RepID=UPI003A8748FA